MGADPYAKISLENSGKMKIISKKQAGLGAQETNPNPNISNDHDNESGMFQIPRATRLMNWRNNV